jgi:hypothetical protein
MKKRFELKNIKFFFEFTYSFEIKLETAFYWLLKNQNYET